MSIQSIELRIPLNKIICDVERRINEDNKGLVASIKKLKQMTPIQVEGPDENGFFYIIKGTRRFQALKTCRSRSAKVVVMGPLTTRENRNKIRSEILQTSKRPSRVEKTNTWESSGCDLKDLPRDKQRKYTRSIQVPKEKRQAVAKVRGSQEALEVIWSDLNISEAFREELYQRLINGKVSGKSITSDHAVALKKLASQHEYNYLSEEQKALAINAVLSKGKFSNIDAKVLILHALVQGNTQSEFFNLWMQHIATELIALAERVPNFSLPLEMKVSGAVKYARDKLYQKLNNILECDTVIYGFAASDEAQEEKEAGENYSLMKENPAMLEVEKPNSVRTPLITQIGNVIQLSFPAD